VSDGCPTGCDSGEGERERGVRGMTTDTRDGAHEGEEGSEPHPSGSGSDEEREGEGEGA
jgi:hypothetical protein